MAEQKIVGAVGIGRRVYRAGDEKAFAAALKSDEGKGVDLAALEEAGAIRGFAGARGKGGKGEKSEPADYHAMKVDELQALAEQREIEVEPTGASGAVKADYVKALEAADRAAAQS